MRKINSQKITRYPLRANERGEKKEDFAGKNVLCNLCGGNNSSLFLKSPGPAEKKTSFSTTSQAVAGESIVKCQDCGLIYVNPRPPDWLVKKEYSLKEEKEYIKDARGRIVSFQRSLKIIKSYRGSGKILDVGCAAGFFLKIAKDGGFEVYGVEPNHWLADWGRKNLMLDIFPRSFEKANFPGDFFDVATFWDVLEHLTDPLGALARTNRILKKGGIVVVNYPDIDSLPAKVFGKRWWFVISGHLFYFTPETISKMLAKAGFEVIKNQHHFQTLSLSYLLTRLGRYNFGLAQKLSNFSQLLGLGNVLIPYYAGQRTVIARKH